MKFNFQIHSRGKNAAEMEAPKMIKNLKTEEIIALHSSN